MSEIYSILHYRNNKLIFTDLLNKENLDFIIREKLKLSKLSGFFTYDKCKIKFTNGKFKQKINKDYYIVVYNDDGKTWKKTFDGVLLQVSNKKGE